MLLFRHLVGAFALSQVSPQLSPQSWNMSFAETLAAELGQELRPRVGPHEPPRKDRKLKASVLRLGPHASSASWNCLRPTGSVGGLNLVTREPLISWFQKNSMYDGFRLNKLPFGRCLLPLMMAAAWWASTSEGLTPFPSPDVHAATVKLRVGLSQSPLQTLVSSGVAKLPHSLALMAR